MYTTGLNSGFKAQINESSISLAHSIAHRTLYFGSLERILCQDGAKLLLNKKTVLYFGSDKEVERKVF